MRTIFNDKKVNLYNFAIIKSFSNVFILLKLNPVLMIDLRRTKVSFRGSYSPTYPNFSHLTYFSPRRRSDEIFQGLKRTCKANVLYSLHILFCDVLCRELHESNQDQGILENRHFLSTFLSAYYCHCTYFKNAWPKLARLRRNPTGFNHF